MLARIFGARVYLPPIVAGDARGSTDLENVTIVASEVTSRVLKCYVSVEVNPYSGFHVSSLVLRKYRKTQRIMINTVSRTYYISIRSLMRGSQ